MHRNELMACFFKQNKLNQNTIELPTFDLSTLSNKDFLQYFNHKIVWLCTPEGSEYWYKINIKFIMFITQHNRKRLFISMTDCISNLDYAIRMTSKFKTDKFVVNAKQYLEYLKYKYSYDI